MKSRRYMNTEKPALMAPRVDQTSTPYLMPGSVWNLFSGTANASGQSGSGLPSAAFCLATHALASVSPEPTLTHQGKKLSRLSEASTPPDILPMGVPAG